MARRLSYPQRYFMTLDEAGKIDYYEKQIAFWASVIKHYPYPRYKTQHRYMEKRLEELTLQ